MIIAQLMRLDGPLGVIRLSSLPFEWTDAFGAVWSPGAFLSISPRGSTSAIDGGSLSIVWSGASAALLATAQNPGIIRSQFRMVTVFLGGEPLVQVGAEFDAFAGLAETPEVSADPANPKITITVQSPMLDLVRARPVRLKGAERMQDIDPGLAG